MTFALQREDSHVIKWHTLSCMGMYVPNNFNDLDSFHA